MIVTALQAELDKRTGSDDEPTDQRSRRSNVLTTDELIALAISGDIPLAKWTKAMLTDAHHVLTMREDDAQCTRGDDCIALIAATVTQQTKAGNTSSARVWLSEFGLSTQADAVIGHVGARAAKLSLARGTGRRA